MHNPNVMMMKYMDQFLGNQIPSGPLTSFSWATIHIQHSILQIQDATVYRD